MWGWAYKGPTGSPSSTPTPANPTPGPSRPIDSGTPPNPKSASASPDAEEEEEEDLPAPPRAMEEEEGEEPDPRKDRPRKSLWQGPRRPAPPRRKRVVVPMPFDRTKVPRSKRGIRPLARISQYQNDLMLKSLWEEGYKLYDSNAPTSDEESDQNDNLVASEDDDPSPSPSDDDEMDVDDDAEDQDPASPRQSPTRPTLNTNLKLTPPPSTSAMDPGPDDPSVPPSISASLDPTASPPDEDVRPGAIPDEDIDQDHYPDALDDDDCRPAPRGDIEADGDEDEDAPPEEPSQPPSPTPLAEPEPEPEDEDPDLQPAHRAEALDVLATIELRFALLRERVYVEKMEGLAWEEALVWDGQYAMFSHYSVLIHLVISGTHPELHYLQSELTKRRDKRLLLASRKRTYEIEALTKRRREEETWCWEGWDVSSKTLVDLSPFSFSFILRAYMYLADHPQIARTELQTEMIAETNRKRRKLERERRTVERPPGGTHTWLLAFIRKLTCL
jgi:hypothetical protein